MHGGLSPDLSDLEQVSLRNWIHGKSPTSTLNNWVEILVVMRLKRFVVGDFKVCVKCTPALTKFEVAQCTQPFYLVEISSQKFIMSLAEPNIFSFLKCNLDMLR
jgi:hypothetical protein